LRQIITALGIIASRKAKSTHFFGNRLGHCLALLDETNTTIKMLGVFPRLAMKDGQFRLRADSLLLKSGEPLENVSEFLEVMRRIG
jgi:hypothetical protein